jgi:ribosomal-protein-alanine acetyltransferase
MMDIKIISAQLEDLDELLALEQASFDSDILSKASFRHFIQSDKSDLIVAKKSKKILGYALMLYKRGTSLSRLYSIAVDPNARGMGLGEKLLKSGEDLALERNKTHLRLEVRMDNQSAISLYKKLGYREFGRKLRFYEDNSDALCFEKRLLPSHLGFKFKVPYFHQHTDFTCGAASLLMAMAAHNKKITPSFDEELMIWREATTIYMTSGHGGCGPRGLALAGHRRGFKVEVWVSHRGPMFLDGVRTQVKKEVVNLVHNHFQKEIQRFKIPVNIGRLSGKIIEKAVKKQGIPLILISSYMITKSKAPHWVVLAGYDEDHFYIHDPEWENSGVDIGDKLSSNAALPDVAYIPVSKKDFLKMARYGGSKDQACVVIYPPSNKRKMG